MKKIPEPIHLLLQLKVFPYFLGTNVVNLFPQLPDGSLLFNPISVRYLWYFWPATGLKTGGWSQFGGEACCDSDWESWVKRQRNALSLRPCERALWQTTIKSPIVAANVKLIGRTLREEPLSSWDSFILRVTAGFSCVSPGCCSL